MYHGETSLTNVYVFLKVKDKNVKQVLVEDGSQWEEGGQMEG
jgi:hypothetical protein